MKYLSTFIPAAAAPGGPPSPEGMAKMEKLIEECTRAGVLLATGGLMPATQGGAKLRCAGGQISVIDGPYMETKELVAGFGVLETDTREEMIELTKRFLEFAGDGECEVRRIMDAGEAQSCGS